MNVIVTLAWKNACQLGIQPTRITQPLEKLPHGHGESQTMQGLPLLVYGIG